MCLIPSPTWKLSMISVILFCLSLTFPLVYFSRKNLHFSDIYLRFLTNQTRGREERGKSFELFSLTRSHRYQVLEKHVST